MIILPAEIGCEVGLHEGENGVTHLASQHPGPNSWMWGGARGDGQSMMVGVVRKGRCVTGDEVTLHQLNVTLFCVYHLRHSVVDLPLLLLGSVTILVYPRSLFIPRR